MSHISGLALSIRSSTESDTFDLAGQTAGTITNTITAAFSEPFPLRSKMIRITLVTGAGKLARQKYDEGAAKAVTSALRKLGFEDDSSASCVPQCAGTFKLQHDTGKNLKTVVIFPKILEGDAKDSSSPSKNSLLLEGSPEHTCLILSLEAFQKLVQTKCPSWSQKRECLHSLSSIIQTLTNLETKLLNGEPLTEQEQDFYDTSSFDILQNKESFLKKEMSGHIETGTITQFEKNKLLEQVDEKLKTVKTQNAMEKLKHRKQMLKDIKPVNPHKLKNEGEIIKLRKEMLPLIKLENGAKGRLLTLKETTALGRKSEILEEIKELENSSQEWFEDDDVFQYRLKFHRDQIKVKEKEQQKKQVHSKPNTTFKVSTGGWDTMSKAKPQKAKKPTTSTSVFSSMLMDSDSD